MNTINTIISNAPDRGVRTNLKCATVFTALAMMLLASTATAGDTPLDQRARRAGEDVRRKAEDFYNQKVPEKAKKTVEDTRKTVDQAGKAARGFIKGLTGK